MFPLGRPSRRCLALALAAYPAGAAAAPWVFDPGRVLPGSGGVTQKLELVDINADGFVDLVFATSRGDNTGSDADAQFNAIILNDKGAGFLGLLGVFDEPDNAFAIKAGDLDGDGDPDLVVGVNFGGQSYVILHEGDAFSRLDIAPGTGTSIGDLELGDLDGDGDLDVLAVDWGDSQPFDDPQNPGGPVRLWLGDGLGGFTDGQDKLPLGMESFVSWSHDLELFDLDNDFDLDAAIASRGAGHALVLENDGAGNFSLHPVPPLQTPFKLVNSAFTVVDLNADGALDLVTLQDGPAGANTVLIGDGAGHFADNVGAYWALVDNPPRRDFDAATLDFNNDGTPDVVVTGIQQNPGEVNSRLMLNDGASLEPVPPDGAAFPVHPLLERSFGVLLADFDGDRRDDAAVAIRDELVADLVLFGGPDVPEDITPPRIDAHELLPPLIKPGEPVRIRARIHDAKIPARWHDFAFDPQLPTYSLAPGAVTAHLRRLPYLEYTVGLTAESDLPELADDDPNKILVPGVWAGGAQWRFAFTVPVPQELPDFFAWRICAIDAAGNKDCTPIRTSEYVCNGNGVCEPPLEDKNNCVEDCEPAVACGDGFCHHPPETALNCPADCSCNDDGICQPYEWDDCCDCLIDCGLTCGDGICVFGESPRTCPYDCGECGDGICISQFENMFNCPEDCSRCGDCVCQPGEDPTNCPEDCSADACPGPTTGNTPCGDGVCEPPENSLNCPQDCGPPQPPSPFCGDDVCTAPEDPETCPEDCGRPECLDTCDGGPDSDTTGASADPGGCGCRGEPLGGVLGLLVALFRRRRNGQMAE